VPGHAVVRRNERVDRPAGTAVISDGRAIDQAVVFFMFSVRRGEWKTHLDIMSQTLWKD
jgi:hypothetical protein